MNQKDGVQSKKDSISIINNGKADTTNLTGFLEADEELYKMYQQATSMNNICISPSGTGKTTILFNKVNKQDFDEGHNIGLTEMLERDDPLGNYFSKADT